MKINKLNKEQEKFHVYWQCPKCGIVNINTSNNALLNITKFECNSCKNKYILQKKITQVLCQPCL